VRNGVLRLAGVLAAFTLLSLAVPLPYVEELRTEAEAAQSSACDKNPKPANLNFVLKDAAGKDFNLASQKGKVILLDFWATWCGPCIAEIPNVKQAYADWHDKGFEILGISFDDEDMAEKVTEFTKKREMPWQQIYEGKVWDTTLGEQYDVGSIPFVLLVDGDTNEILATRRELRGPALSEFIEKALAKKSGADK
jgi:thiol-disulfide isomerase/thioredoxin